jgi:hypothetical protein
MTTPSFLKTLAIPRVLKGASGNYWQIAANDSKSREFFVRLKFERMPSANEGGKVELVEGLQINLIYLGGEFDLVGPFMPLEARPYMDGDKQVKGLLLAKLWIPMGEFHKNVLEMYQHAQKEVSTKVEEVFAPLFASAEVKVTIPLKDIFGFLISDLEQAEKHTLPVQVFVNQSWIAHIATIQQKNKEAISAMQATAQESSTFDAWEKSFEQKNLKGNTPPKPEPEAPTGPTAEPEF